MSKRKDRKHRHDRKDRARPAAPAPTAAPAEATAREGWLRGLARFDLRSLGLFRIALALLLLEDLAVRASWLRAHYTDQGAVPVELARHADQDSVYHWSLHLLSGDAGLQILLFGLAALAAFALLVGYRSRLAAGVSWALLLSLQNRNLFVLNGGDLLFRQLALFAAFSPIGARFSLDRRLRRGDGRIEGESRLSTGALAIALQLLMVYLFAAILKAQVRDWGTGGGTEGAFWTDAFVTSWAIAVREHLPHWVYLALDWLTLLVEGVAPLALLAPDRSGTLRTALAIGFIHFHLMLGVFLHLGDFSWVASIAWIPLLGAPFWRVLERWLPSAAGPVPAGPAETARPVATRRDRFVAAAPLALASLALLWNLFGIHAYVPEQSRMPQPLRPLALLFGQDQNWAMFARPARSVQWWVFPAKLADGTYMDLFHPERTEGFSRFLRPELLAFDFPTDRWRKLLHAAARPGMDGLRADLLRSFCALWNEKAPRDRQALVVSMVQLRQPLVRNPATDGLALGFQDEHETLGTQECVPNGLVEHAPDLDAALERAERAVEGKPVERLPAATPGESAGPARPAPRKLSRRARPAGP